MSIDARQPVRVAENVETALQTGFIRAKLLGSSFGNEAGQEPWNSYPKTAFDERLAGVERAA